jgi:hypothetical protein
MTAEQVFIYYRAYKFFYKAKAPTDFEKYTAIKCPPLIEQKDRQFFHRIANRLSQDTVHALFISSFFYQPNAYIANIATPDAFEKAMLFAGRWQNADTLLEHNLYQLKKRFVDDTVDGLTPILEYPTDWLYGKGGTTLPPVIQDVIAGDLPLDLACILLLVSQPDLKYHWLQDIPPDDSGLGTGPWVDRLKKADRLISFVRPAWRLTAQRLSKEFWHSLNLPSLAPAVTSVESSLF